MLSLNDRMIDYLRSQPWFADADATIAAYKESAKRDQLLLGEQLMKEAPDNAVAVVLPQYASAIVCAHFALPILNRPIVWLATNGALSMDQLCKISERNIPAVFAPSYYWECQWYSILANGTNPLRRKWTMLHQFALLSNYDLEHINAEVIGKPIPREQPTPYLEMFKELGSVNCDLSYICRLPKAMRDAFIGGLWGKHASWFFMKFEAMAMGWEPIEEVTEEHEALIEVEKAKCFPGMPQLAKWESDWLRDHREEVDRDLANYCKVAEKLDTLIEEYQLQYYPTTVHLTQGQLNYINYHLSRQRFACRASATG